MPKCKKCNLEMKLSKDGKWWYCPENSRNSEHKGFLKNIQPAQESTSAGSSDEILKAIALLKADMNELLGIWRKIQDSDQVVLYPKKPKGINPDLAGEIKRDAPKLEDKDPSEWEEEIPF